MKSTTSGLSALLAVSIVLTVSVAPPLQAQNDAAPPENKVSKAGNTFGFKLFAELLKQDKDKNIFISPSSVAIALAMTCNGADGDTRDAMAAALELRGLKLEDVNAGFAALRKTLENPDPKVQLTIANSLWARKGIPFREEFLGRNKDFYAAQISQLNFDSPEAPATINKWVSDSTRGKIQKIVGDRIDGDTILFLINAIYFKGKWADEFDKKQTQERNFTLLNGATKKHPMMSQNGDYRYMRGTGFQAVSLPYGGGRVSMYLFLPDKDSSLKTFLGNLTAENWEKWMSQFRKTPGEIVLPRYKLEYEASLNDALKALGMAVAFDPGRADFSQMCSVKPENVYIQDVKHKTFVEVNEEGTEAAAVTSVKVGITSVQIKPEPFSMIVDRPFFCAIRDNKTGAVLFMGAIVEPK